MFDKTPQGATPIDPDEAADLIPQHVQTLSDLNAWEQLNILNAQRWADRSRVPAISERMVRDLHQRMFDRTWRWAGKYRTSDKNLGTPWTTISVEVRKMIDDAQHWIDNDIFTIDEVAARLHHRIVKVHPFVNGNGRHARLWCDTILRQFGRNPFCWPQNPENTNDARNEYINALQSADDNDFQPLIDILLRNRT